MNQIQPRKTLSLRFKNNVKIYDLEDDFEIEKNINTQNIDINTDNLNDKNKFEENPVEIENHKNSETSENLENYENNSQKKIYKKTLSRIVFVQLIDSILSTESLRSKISTNLLIERFSDLINFINENNFYECNFLQNKQLANNFIYDLFVTFNQNYSKIEKSIRNSCKNHWEIYINESIYSSIIYSAISESIYAVEKKINKDYKKIIINEYLLISEYFLNENEIKFVNGILNTIFYKNADKTQKTTELLSLNILN